MGNAAPGFEKHPNYQITIEPRDERVQVHVGETLLADTTDAVLVTESRHRPVWYLPLDAVAADLVTATETSSYCPFKGHASYWSVNTEAQTLNDVMWSYREPFDECAQIRDFVAFYTNKVNLTVNGESVGEAGPGWTD
ncbi:MAG: DUF427 domain-containing protein [Pseudomonadales bacterium]